MTGRRVPDPRAEGTRGQPRNGLHGLPGQTASTEAFPEAFPDQASRWRGELGRVDDRAEIQADQLNDSGSLAAVSRAAVSRAAVLLRAVGPGEAQQDAKLGVHEGLSPAGPEPIRSPRAPQTLL